MQCLGLLYQRQYSASADYGLSLKREQVIEIFEETLARSSHTIFDDQDDLEQRFKNHREHANWVLKSLIDAGWLEKQVDNATFQSTYPFSRLGRLFTQSLLEADSTQIRTRHRNTRNTLNALEAFSSRGEIYDLLDAFDYSERIITDFTDIITELEDKKRELVREVESQQLIHQASDQFFEYMEKRFQPDISVRLSADSVEKHRDEINRVIAQIRRKNKDFKQHAEKGLRQSAPQLCLEHQSYLWFALDTIEQRMRNASDIMLPALRRALHGFTRRADIVIRQLSYLSTQNDDDLLDVCRELADLDQESAEQRINQASHAMASLNLSLIDPKQVKLQEQRKRAQVDSRFHEMGDIDLGARKHLLAQQLLDQAFVFNREDLRDYVSTALAQGQSIFTQHMPINDARDLLALAHVIEVGSVNSLDSDLRFNVEYHGSNKQPNEYFDQADSFEISLLEHTPNPPSDAN